MATCRQSSRLAARLAGLCIGVLAGCQPSSGAPASVTLRLHAVGNFVSALAFDERGAELLAVADANRVSVWRSPTNGAAPTFIANANGKIASVGFSGAGGVLAATTDGAIVEWDVSTERVVFNHRLYGSGLSAHSADGRYWAMGGALFDRAALRDADPLRVDEQTALQFSADSARLLSVGRHPTLVVVRELMTGRTFQHRLAADAQLGALSPRGDRVAIALRSGEIQVFRVPDFQAQSSFWGPTALIALQFLEDNEHLVSVAADGLQVHEASTSWLTYRSAVAGGVLAFALNRGVASAGTAPGKVWVWDLARGVLLASGQASSSPVRAVAVSAFAQRVAAGDETGAVTVLGW